METIGHGAVRPSQQLNIGTSSLSVHRQILFMLSTLSLLKPVQDTKIIYFECKFDQVNLRFNLISGRVRSVFPSAENTSANTAWYTSFHAHSDKASGVSLSTTVETRSNS